MVKWKKIDRKLEIGEIIRRKLEDPNKPPKDWAGYIYGRVVNGFGMYEGSMGYAIFVENEDWTFEKCAKQKSDTHARWERSLEIEIME